VTGERSPEAERLLGLASDYLLAHGLGGTSLSRLARGIGSNNRMVLYYFGSRERLFAEALVVAYERFPALHGLMPGLRDDGELRGLLKRGWRQLRDPGNLPFLTLFFEAFALAVREPGEHRPHLDVLSSTWTRDMREALRAHGHPARDAELLAPQVIALWRGLQFALLAGDDVAGLDAAHDAAIDALLG